MCNFRAISVAVFITLLFGSCTVGKQLAYLQDVNDTTRIQELRAAALEPIRLLQDDQVQVTITSRDRDGMQLFSMIGTSISSGTDNQIVQNVYTINSHGTINIPLLGEIKIIGLTTEEARLKIQEEAVQYIKDAMVGLNLMNFRITVMGEVTHPATLQVAGEKVNLLEAIGMAGDLTVYGKRANVKVIRKSGDKVEVGHINLNNSKLFTSPFYNLRQNDIVYVEPFPRKASAAERTFELIPIVLSALTVVVLAFRIVR